MLQLQPINATIEKIAPILLTMGKECPVPTGSITHLQGELLDILQLTQIPDQVPAEVSQIRSLVHVIESKIAKGDSIKRHFDRSIVGLFEHVTPQHHYDLRDKPSF